MSSISQNLKNIFIIISVINGINTEFDYCEIDCNGTDHTVCKYPAGGGANCQNIELVYLTLREKKWILELHNNFREDVAGGTYFGQPKAGNMMKLSWNGELGLFAKRWADQCGRPLHDGCRTTMDGVSVGQNVYFGNYTSEIPDTEVNRAERIRRILKSWEDEGKTMDPGLVQHYKYNESVSNYTQMIWGTTTDLGCGYTEFKINNLINFRFVCNYKHAGNREGQHIYRKGHPCSSCPYRTNCSVTWPGLCWDGSESWYIDKVVDATSAVRASYLVVVVSWVSLCLCYLLNMYLE